MASLDAFIDLTQVDRALADVETRAKRARPAFRELRKPLRVDQRQHAREESGPNGKWEQRATGTINRMKAHARNKRANRKRLHPKTFKRQSMSSRILGRLPNALIVTAGDLFVRVTSRVDWGGIHQAGGRVGKHATVPKRVFLWLSDEIVRISRDKLLEHVLTGWKK